MSMNDSQDMKSKEKKMSWGRILIYFFLLPYIFMYFYAKFTLNAIREKNKAKMVLSAVILVFFIFSAYVGSDATSSSDVLTSDSTEEEVPSNNKADDNETLEIVTEAPIEDLRAVHKNLKSFESDELILNFIEACESSNINISAVKKLEKIDGWIAGERYRFAYHGKDIILYTNMDSSISSIRSDSLKVFLFREGYESLNVDDYITSSSITSNLESISKQYVKGKLNYPETARFGLFDWGFGRFQDYYVVSGKVTAKNAFGVKEELRFYFEYLIEDTNAKLVTFAMDGVYVVGNESKIKNEYVGAKIEDLIDNGVNDENDSNIVIVEYNKLGDLGKEITIGNVTSIGYFLSAGEYEVTNLVNYAVLMIFKEKTIFNSDGNEERVMVERIVFDAYESKKNISINEDEYLYLSLNSKLKLSSLD